MRLWARFLQAIGFQTPASSPPAGSELPLEGVLADSIQALAAKAQRSKAEIAADLLAGALIQQEVQAELEMRWQSLTNREREVALLICQGWTYRQMSSHLYVSTETIKAHIRRILRKYDLHSMAELRLLITGWQDSGWDLPDRLSDGK